MSRRVQLKTKTGVNAFPITLAEAVQVTETQNLKEWIEAQASRGRIAVEHWEPEIDVVGSTSKHYFDIGFKPKIITIWRTDAIPPETPNPLGNNDALGGIVTDYAVARRGGNASGSHTFGGYIYADERITDDYFILPAITGTSVYRAGYTYDITYYEGEDEA